jgi:uncharacterized protein (DUF885 family)
MSNKKFEDLSKEILEWKDKTDPVLATIWGIHKYDSLLGKYDTDSISAQKAKIQEYRNRLEEINEEELAEEKRIDYRLLGSMLRSLDINYTKLEVWKRNANVYPDIVMSGVYFLLVMDFAPLEERCKNILSRLRLIPQVLDEGKRNIVEPPKVFVEVAIDTTSGGIAFLKDSIPRVAKKVEKLRADLLEANENAIKNLDDYLAFLNKLLPNAKDDFAAGKELFEEIVRNDYFLEYTADDLWEIGRKAFGDTKKEMEQIAADVGKGLDSLLEESKREHPEPEELLQYYQDRVDEIRRFIKEKDLVPIPSGEKLVVKPTPLFLRSKIPAAAYEPPGPYNDEQVGIFLVTPISQDEKIRAEQLKIQNKYDILLTALHEGYPGHHLQLSWASKLSSDVRKHFLSLISAEGWAVYCEELMGEEGFYKDKREVLAKLRYQLLRVTTLLIDVGLHTRGKSIDEMVEFFVRELHWEERGALAAVRSIAIAPASRVAYYIGKMQVMALRDKFPDKRKFHSAFLKEEIIPPKLVEETVMRLK